MQTTTNDQGERTPAQSYLHPKYRDHSINGRYSADQELRNANGMLAALRQDIEKNRLVMQQEAGNMTDVERQTFTGVEMGQRAHLELLRELTGAIV